MTNQEQFNWDTIERQIENRILCEFAKYYWFDGVKKTDNPEDWAVFATKKIVSSLKETCVPRESYAELEAKLQKVREWYRKTGYHKNKEELKKIL